MIYLPSVALIRQRPHDSRVPAAEYIRPEPSPNGYPYGRVYIRPKRNHMVTIPQHWHVWRMASTGRAAFMGRPFLTRAAARKAAERWAGQYRRALTFVHECSLAECPRPPRRERAVQP